MHTFTTGLPGQYYLWTRNEEELPVLLSEASKAIRKLVSKTQSKLSDEFQQALDEEDVEQYTELFTELIAEGSKEEIELAFQGAKALADKDFDHDLLAVIAVSSIKTGTKALNGFATAIGLADRVKEMDDEFNENFILSLQRIYQDFLYGGDDWQASEGLIKQYYDNISEVMQIFGYKVKKMAIMTMIFLFYNDIIDGIGFDSYMDDEDYRDEEWPYTDTDLSFWENFDPDSVTGLKTEKGVYQNRNG